MSTLNMKNTRYSMLMCALGAILPFASNAQTIEDLQVQASQTQQLNQQIQIESRQLGQIVNSVSALKAALNEAQETQSQAQQEKQRYTQIAEDESSDIDTKIAALKSLKQANQQLDPTIQRVNEYQQQLDSALENEQSVRANLSDLMQRLDASQTQEQVLYDGITTNLAESEYSQQFLRQVVSEVQHTEVCDSNVSLKNCRERALAHAQKQALEQGLSTIVSEYSRMHTNDQGQSLDDDFKALLQSKTSGNILEQSILSQDTQFVDNQTEAQIQLSTTVASEENSEIYSAIYNYYLLNVSAYTSLPFMASEQTFLVSELLPEANVVVEAAPKMDEVVEQETVEDAFEEELEPVEESLVEADLEIMEEQGSPSLDSFYTVNGVSFAMKYIPAGDFQRGSDEGYNDEKPVMQVNINAFQMMETEVTLALFEQFVDDTGFDSKGCRHWTTEWVLDEQRDWQNPGYEQSGLDPVTCVSWDAVVSEFIPWVNEKTGETFRLPSEAEWEYAARAENLGVYHFGDDESYLCEYANGADEEFRSAAYERSGRNVAECNDGYAERTAPVKSFEANSFGLYDMYGNAWEWIQDCYNKSYETAPVDGSAFEFEGCKYRVLRGGSWDTKPNRLRSANRNGAWPLGQSNVGGFRLAKDL
jgi:formylglycine-generating enzyme required for sulfatase activity/regulator of replication initiation timing